ncbi:hypothetical protein BG53_15635 [Paenibacillus darwinianus]|uniref:RNA-binding protein KhpB N-terminal domain-containing protein n=1 Tax=Paenibacillus darwinianus TaxID=1380763 RepID=A0A9W5S1G6_9BACL|nr:flagellar assembly protein A [Paenibacillus darwinianus]EXX89497.1 hypothetical protein BG53_15635 [Paenibacillus darwinianus]EXX91201.1 hypothetical protein CH50_14010 [Paenibacillus darwinianus]EXX92534.1 hypothetical protein BG52_10795 [Paenibacillus darwinianus]
MKAQGKSIISKGKNVKEAVMIALDLLNEKLDAVDVVVMENGSKGILGLGSKLAVVRVTVIGRTAEPVADLEAAVESMELPELADAPMGSENKRTFEDESLSGKAWIRNGQINCKEAPDKYPMVKPCDKVQLYKNNELVKNAVLIRETDHLTVDIQDEIREPVWELEIRPGKMSAVLKIVPGFRIRRKIKDKAPDTCVQIEVEEKKIPLVIETEPLLEKLRELGIVHGVDYTEIARACTTDEAGTFVIAVGTPPSPGKNGYFLPLQELEVKKGLKERSDGSIDYRELQQFPSVEPGQVLGTVRPPVPGVPGSTVTGEAVYPPEALPLALLAGKGIIAVEDAGGTRIIATEAGHPDVKLKGRSAQISIVTMLRIGKDVDLQLGNVHYAGDVEIVGSVQDGMLVEAQGNIMVYGNINMAKVSAGSSVIVRHNIVTSEVTAGKSSFLKAEIHQLLSRFVQQMRLMEAAIQQLSTVPAFKASSFTRTGLGPLIKILCDGKFKSFPALTQSLIHKIESGQDVLEKEWKDFAQRLHKGFIMSHASEFKSVEDIVQTIQMAEQFLADTSDEEQGAGCFIKAGGVHNSRLYSSGDITISAQGIYQSIIRSGGHVEVEGSVRGGEIYASKSVKIGETGTKGGAPTKIVVPKGETIKINDAMEETVVQVGARIYKFDVRSSNVYARLDSDGELLLY